MTLKPRQPARHVDNAFTRGGLASASPRSFEPLRAQHKADRTVAALGERASWTLSLSPMRLVDALPTWCSAEVAEADAAHDHGVTLVIDATFDSSAGRTTPANLAMFVRDELRQSGEPAGVAIVDDQSVVLCDEQLIKMAMNARFTSVTLVRIAAPIDAIESGDVKAIRAALAGGLHSTNEGAARAWHADLRAVAAMRVDGDRAVALQTTCEKLALILVAENLRHFLAATLDREVDSIGWPGPWQMKRLLSVSGALAVRPIETDIFTTFIDVGICTDRDEASPAAQSLIYDLPSTSWHDES